MTKVDPRISVIITAHNEERFIGRCLRSIINQTLLNVDYEVIVVNDASTDKTAYALAIFGDSIKVIQNDTNLGLPSCINLGVNYAKGHYIVRLDADDYVNVNYLNFLSCFLDWNEEYDAVACDYLLVDDNERVLGKFDARQKPIGCGVMFSREHLLEIGLYDESFLVHEDRDLKLRFEKVYKTGHLNLPLYRYRKHEGNMTNDDDLMRLHDSRLQLKHKHG